MLRYLVDSKLVVHYWTAIDDLRITLLPLTLKSQLAYIHERIGPVSSEAFLFFDASGRSPTLDTHAQYIDFLEQPDLLPLTSQNLYLQPIQTTDLDSNQTTLEVEW